MQCGARGEFGRSSYTFLHFFSFSSFIPSSSLLVLLFFEMASCATEPGKKDALEEFPAPYLKEQSKRSAITAPAFASSTTSSAQAHLLFLVHVTRNHGLRVKDAKVVKGALPKVKLSKNVAPGMWQVDLLAENGTSLFTLFMRSPLAMRAEFHHAEGDHHTLDSSPTQKDEDDVLIRFPYFSNASEIRISAFESLPSSQTNSADSAWKQIELGRALIPSFSENRDP